MKEALGWLVEQLGTFGAAILYYGALLAWLSGSAWCGIKIAKLRKSNWQGWAVGILAALLIGIALWPAMEALKAISCKGSNDFEACIEGNAYEY